MPDDQPFSGDPMTPEEANRIVDGWNGSGTDPVAEADRRLARLREQYAGQAMQAIVTNQGVYHIKGLGVPTFDEMAEKAVQCADALIRALGNG